MNCDSLGGKIIVPVNKIQIENSDKHVHGVSNILSVDQSKPRQKVCSCTYSREEREREADHTFSFSMIQKIVVADSSINH